jgi:hypothetical protein
MSTLYAEVEKRQKEMDEFKVSIIKEVESFLVNNDIDLTLLSPYYFYRINFSFVSEEKTKYATLLCSIKISCDDFYKEYEKGRKYFMLNETV